MPDIKIVRGWTKGLSTLSFPSPRIGEGQGWGLRSIRGCRYLDSSARQMISTSFPSGSFTYIVREGMTGCLPLRVS